MKTDWFRYLITGSFLWVLLLEGIAIYTGQFTISDFIFLNVRLKYRIAMLALLVFHFVWEYPAYR